MSRNSAKEFRNASQQDLAEKKHTFEKELFELRQKKVVGQLEKPHMFKVLKRKIAQINTIQRENQNVSKRSSK